jgi:glycosyltransferase involved in cell wall biosynthesis
MFYINELTRPMLAMLPPHLRAKAVFVADCCHDMTGFGRSQARKELGIDDTRFVLLAVGELTARKGLSRLLDAAAGVWSRKHAPLCLLVGGSSDGLSLSDLTTLKQHAQTPARCLFFDGFQPTRRMKLMFAASDAVWLGYEGFNEMSGTLMQSVAFGIPIVATANGLIGFLANRYHLGPTVPARGVAAVVEAIESLCQDRVGYAEYVRGCAEMKQAYSAVPFGTTIAALLTRAVAGAPIRVDPANPELP